MASMFAKHVYYAGHVTNFAHVKEISDVSKSWCRKWRTSFPFEIEIAPVEAFYYFELISDSPVFCCSFFEIDREVFVYHGAGKLLSRQASETSAHEFEDDLLISVIWGVYFIPTVYQLFRLLWLRWILTLSLNLSIWSRFLRPVLLIWTWLLSRVDRSGLVVLFGSSLLLFSSCILFLKLWSFVYVWLIDLFCAAVLEFIIYIIVVFFVVAFHR